MDKIIYEYCVLRYVPDLEREEFVNVGLLMMSKRHKWLRSGLFIDSNKIDVISNNCDKELLKRQLSIFERDDVPQKDIPVEEKYRWMAAVKSAIIQTSPSHPGIIFGQTEHAHTLLEEKFSELFDRLVR